MNDMFILQQHLTMFNVKKLCTLLLSLTLFAGLHAQELNCKVTVNTPKLQTADPKIFQTMKTSIENFMNSQRWTNDVYEPYERINCQIQITIESELSPTRFQGEIIIQATRPVYGSNYQTFILNHADKHFAFDYEQYQPIEYAKDIYSNNLVSVLSFYAYVIIGLDGDSFAHLGGNKFFQTANEILVAVPEAARETYKGWGLPKDGNRNRYWIIENLLNPKVTPWREAMYQYHRQGLDLMADNPVAGKADMAAALAKIDQVNRNVPNLMILQMFANAKREEIIEVFKAGTADEKNKVLEYMTRIDPASASKYRQIKG
jgi:hypothetical protein